MRLIDADVLFERACNLEAQALAYVGKIVNDESKIEEWKIWSAILAERTAFKHDIFDAPEVKPERKKGKWIDRGWSGDGRGNSWHEWECSECKHITKGAKWDFCPNCGADMRIPVEIARNIVHEVIDNSVWSDAVDTAEMHKVVDDKYAEIRGDANVNANT